MKKIIKLCDAGINPLDRIVLSDFKADSYDDLKRYYIDLLVQNINEYIYEARDRKKIYEQSYEEYKSKFDNQREKIEDLKRQLEKTGVFSFAKKRNLKKQYQKNYRN